MFAADQTLSTYYDGLEIVFDANFTNTGSATLNVDAVAAATIKKHHDQDLEAGDIEAGQKVAVIYDGTNWQLMSPLGNASASTDLTNTFTEDQTIQSTVADATTGPQLILDRESASPAAADNLGELVFRGESSTGADVDYAGVRGELVDPTNANPDGEVIIETNVAGTKGPALHVGQGVYTPSATGGDKGADSLNASEIYDDDVQVHALANGLDTQQASTSGTAIDFTGIRSDAHRITIMFEGVSLSGTGALLVQLGDSVGFENSGYVSTSVETRGAGTGANVFATTGFIIRQNVASDAFYGHMVLTLMDSATNKWIQSHTGRTATNKVVVGGGGKSLSDTLTQVRITRSNADIFDAGSINILVE